MVTLVLAHHKYQQQYVELRRSLAWLGELQLTSASAERGSAADYMQIADHTASHNIKRQTSYKVVNLQYDGLFLHLLVYNMIRFILILICSVVLISIWVWLCGHA